MHWIRTISAELLGLFVDDVRFAVAIIGWIGFNWLLSRHLLAGEEWGGVILFGGLGVILLWSAVRRAGH
jgi:putative Mn2+ efflux pump MntP